MADFWTFLDQHPSIYVAVALLPTVFLVWLASRAPVAAESTSFRTRWLIPLVALATLLAWRWPQLITARELDPDESQFLAAALTLRHDPVFWRSVDGMTSGPLISFVLVPVSLLGASLSYFWARLIGVLAVWVAVTCCYRLVLAHGDRRAASLGLLPAVLFFAVTTDRDFNHYSSELVPVALLAAAAWALWQPAAPSRWLLVIGGLAAGCTPWAKLQSAPIGALIGGIALVRLWFDVTVERRERVTRAWLLAAAALAPTACVAASIWAAGIGEDFFRSYIAQNLFYVDPDSLRALRPSSRYLRRDFAVMGYGVAIVTSALVGSIALHRAWTRRTLVTGSLLLPSAALLVISGVCVLLPGRDYLHYTVLLLPGVVLLHGAALGERRAPDDATSRDARRSVAIAVLCITLLRVTAPLPPLWGSLADNAKQPVNELGALVRSLSVHEPTLAVWGWQHDVYVAAGARQGTRSAYTYWEIVDSPQRDYFRQRYLADFVSRRPAVFVDAVGEATDFFSDRAAAGHETFPALAAQVARDYCQVADLRYARVYARRDLLARTGLSQPEMWKAVLDSEPSEYLDDPEQQDLSRFPLPRDVIGGQRVMIMRPPANVGWTLHGTERELHLNHGYVSDGGEPFERDGAALVVALIAPNGTRRTLSRIAAEPGVAHGGRGPLRILLPPGYAAGSTLTLAALSEANDRDGNGSFYVERIGVVHASTHLPRQFPGFSRPPDEIDAPGATLVGPYRAPELMLQPSTRLRFTLRGYERTLDISSRVRRVPDGTSEETTSVVVRVVATCPGMPPETLLERTVTQSDETADASPRHIALELPRLPAGTVLEIAVDAVGAAPLTWMQISGLRIG